MLTNSQKEHLTYTAIGQVITFIVIWVWGYSYILPWLDTINAAVATTNISVEKYTKTVSDGLSFEETTGLAGKMTEYAELLKIMNSDIDNSRKTIAKPSWELNYLDWLKKVIVNSSEDRDILSQQKEILNSIIPTLSPISWNIEEDNIDLKWFIRFMETKIIKQFNIESTMVLGLQWILPWTKEEWVPETIGTMEIQIAFKWKNKNISDFVNYINTAWDPTLLMDSGTTLTQLLPKDKIPGVMSNPLITLTSFSLENPIDEKKPDDNNSWRATIRLYFRGIGKDDVAYLKENIKWREETLWKSLESSIIDCKSKWPLCWDRWRLLESFQIKFQEYKGWINYSRGNASNDLTDQIYIQANRAKVLKSLEWEFNEIVTER